MTRNPLNYNLKFLKIKIKGEDICFCESLDPFIHSSHTKVKLSRNFYVIKTRAETQSYLIAFHFGQTFTISSRNVITIEKLIKNLYLEILNPLKLIRMPLNYL